MSLPTDVYRLYQEFEYGQLQLLYVGVSRDARERFKQHKRRWYWSNITYATVTRYKTREAAEIIEAAAIANEYPLLNIDRGSLAARSGDAYSAEWDDFTGYMECTIGSQLGAWAS